MTLIGIIEIDENISVSERVRSCCYIRVDRGESNDKLLNFSSSSGIFFFSGILLLSCHYFDALNHKCRYYKT